MVVMLRTNRFTRTMAGPSGAMDNVLHLILWTPSNKQQSSALRHPHLNETLRATLKTISYLSRSLQMAESWRRSDRRCPGSDPGSPSPSRGSWPWHWSTWRSSTWDHTITATPGATYIDTWMLQTTIASNVYRCIFAAFPRIPRTITRWSRPSPVDHDPYWVMPSVNLCTSRGRAAPGFPDGRPLLSVPNWASLREMLYWSSDGSRALTTSAFAESRTSRIGRTARGVAKKFFLAPPKETPRLLF